MSQLINQGDPDVPSGTVSPWVELRVIPRDVILPMLDAQTHRRFMKTHLPLDALRWDPSVKYIFIGRDGRDMIWSAHNHFQNATDTFYQMFDQGEYDGPKLERPSADPRDMFRDLLKGEPSPSQCWPFWGHIRGWWEARNQPNLLLLHFNDLKADLEGEMRRIAKFLEIPDMPEDKWRAAVEHCTFDWMKAHAELASPPQASIAWVDGAQNFINKGTNSRWKDVLSEEESREYEEKARERLGEDCAEWLKNGSKRVNSNNA